MSNSSGFGLRVGRIVDKQSRAFRPTTLLHNTSRPSAALSSANYFFEAADIWSARNERSFQKLVTLIRKRNQERVLQRACLRRLSVAKQSISALLCGLVWTTPFSLSAAYTLIANSSVCGRHCRSISTTEPRRPSAVRVTQGHRKAGKHTPTLFIQDRSFPKTKWHIYNKSAGKRRHLRQCLAARYAIQQAYQQTIYTTNADSARPPGRQRQRGSGKQKKQMSLQSHLSSSALL